MKPNRWLALAFLPLTTTFSFSVHRPRRIRVRASLPSSTILYCHDEDSIDYCDKDLDACLRQRLSLTSEQLGIVHERLATTAVSKKDANDLMTVLSWLESTSIFTVGQLGDLIVGYPLILRMNLETNLKPTISFFKDALATVVVDDDSVGAQDDLDDRLATFLSESPSLLEYNVAKRLVPRLERVRTIAPERVDEDSLQAISTLTDSRFDEWLLRVEMGDNSQDDAAPSQQSNSAPSPAPVGPSSYVILSNLQSGANIGNIVRSASIFGCHECLVVGQKRYRLTGDHGARFDLPRQHFWSHEHAKEYLANKLQESDNADKGGSKNNSIRIYGVEITKDAAPLMRYDPETGIVQFPFDHQYQGAAFIFGNEGQGLSEKQREICDEFLFIPQTRGGTDDGGGSASMNVACAATVVLQAYSLWAGYADAKLRGEKFVAE